MVTALTEAWPARGDGAIPRVVGGRYGLGSKEFTPAMAAAVFDELAEPKPKREFTVGIVDDVTHLSLKYNPEFSTERDDVVRAVFFGLGSDGTVGANKNSVKIIGESTPLYAQGYFVYDSKKSGSTTVSHLRFGPRPINSSYLIERANFVACHQFGFLERNDVLDVAETGASFLLNSPYGPDEVWDHLPEEARRADRRQEAAVLHRRCPGVAQEAELGGRINTVMQTCFFALAGILPRDEAIAKIKDAIKKTYGKRGDTVLRRNFAAVDGALAAHERGVGRPTAVTGAPMLAADDPRRHTRLRETGHRDADRGQGRPASRQRPAGRRYLPDGHHAVRKAEHRPGDPDLGSRHLHPVRPLRPGLPARDHPHQGV